MKRTILIGLAALGGMVASTGFLNAAGHSHVDENCNLTVPRDEMTNADAHQIYLCIADDMGRGYLTGPKKWVPLEFVEQFRTWTPASTLPADPGVHGERFLFTYVNSVGAAEYTQFKDEGAKMPAGTVIAKESFSVGDDGKTKHGPVFFMQKVAEGTSPRTNDWYYMAVQPNGKPLAVNVYKACNECHSAYEGSDYLAYPEEDVRRTGG